jgi:arginine:ornithine antiporter/lysine permease
MLGHKIVSLNNKNLSNLMSDKKLNLNGLVILVIGSIIGGGIFSLPSELTRGAGSFAIILGFIISGIGVLSLAWVYYLLSVKKPLLTNGIYSYSKSGFGDYIGFNTAWLYWISSTLGNVSYATLIFGTLSYFFSIFNAHGNNLYSLIFASILIWAINVFISMGVRKALVLNIIINVSKLAPIILFFVIGLVFFKWHTFSFQFFGNASLGSIYQQIKTTMITNLWAFGGLEAAVVLSVRAKKSRDVGKATVIGLCCIIAIYILTMVVSLGILKRPDIAMLPDPALSYVFSAAIGPLGNIIMMAGLLISVLGSLLGWTLITAEMPYSTAKDGLMPKFLSKKNSKGAAIYAIFFTTLITQLWLLFSYFNHTDYQFLFSLASTSGLIPYVFSVLFLIQIMRQEANRKWKDFVIPLMALLYSLWILLAAGFKYTLFSTVISLMGLILFLFVQRKKQVIVFKTKVEYSAALIIVIISLITLFLIHQNYLHI